MTIFVTIAVEVGITGLRELSVLSTGLSTQKFLSNIVGDVGSYRLDERELDNSLGEGR